jgi:hypothetical protein
MKLTPRSHYASGTVTVERTLKNSSTGKELRRENHTEEEGPFCRDEIHARVGASVSATLARNYHSVNVMVSVNIPAHASTAGVDAGLEWCFSKANEKLNEQLKGANKALDKMASRKQA